MVVVQRWESAWTEYIEALADRDEKYADRFRRGHRRPYKSACYRVRRARRVLERLGAKFNGGLLVTVGA